MRLIIILLISFLLVPLTSKCENQIDSLLQSLNHSNDEDKANTYLLITDKLKFSKPSDAEGYGLLGLEIANERKLTSVLPKLLLKLGQVNAIQSHYDESMDYYRQAMEYFISNEDVKGIGKTHSSIGMIQARKGDYEDSMKSYNKAIMLFETIQDEESAILVKGNVANLDYRKGNYDKALKIYEEILEYGIQTDSDVLIARYYGNIGRAMFRKGDYPKSLRNYYKSMTILERLGNKSSMLNLYNNIGMLFSNLEMYDLALENFENGLALYDTSRNKHHVAMIHSNLGGLYIAKDNYEKAHSHIIEALKIYDDKGIKAKGNLLLNLAEIHLEREQFDSTEMILKDILAVNYELDQDNVLASAYASYGALYFKKRDFLKSNEYYQKSKITFNKVGDIKGLNSVVEELIKVSIELNDKEAEWKYKDQNLILKDSLYGLDKMNQIIRLEMERERSVYQSLQTEQDTVTSKNVLSTGLVAMLLCIFGFVLLSIQRKKIKLKKALYETKNKAAKDTEAIQSALDQQNLEMTFLTLDMAQKDDFLMRIKSELEKFAERSPENKDVRKLISSVYFQNGENKDWELFKQAYQKVFPEFFDNILHDFPKLSSKELRHCALIRLKIPLQEVSEIFGISVNSVHKSRYRLRSKLGLDKNDKLESFIQKY